MIKNFDNNIEVNNTNDFFLQKRELDSYARDWESGQGRWVYGLFDDILDSDSSVDMIKVNDIVWFDFDYICESIGIETEAENK